MCSVRKVTKTDCLVITRPIIYPFLVCLEVGEYFFAFYSGLSYFDLQSFEDGHLSAAVLCKEAA